MTTTPRRAGNGSSTRIAGVGAVASSLAVAAVLLSSCNGGQGPGATSSRTTGLLPTSITASSTRTPIRTSEPTTSEAPTSEAPTSEAPTSEAPTSSATPSPTSSKTSSPSPKPTPTTTPTQEPTSAAPTSETPTPSSTSETPSSTTTTPAEASPAPVSESSGVPAWLWWLLVAVLIGLAVGIPLVVRARRRAAWNAELAAAEDDVAWFARVLVPQLRQSSSVDEVGGGWTVGAARVAAAEDRLTGLEPTAPDEASGTRALTLRDAVRDARGTVQGLVDGGMSSDISPTLDQVVARLEAALAPPIPEV